METELIKELNTVLKAFPQYWDNETLHRSMVVDAINQKDPTLIKALIHNNKIKSLYSTEIDGVLLFDFEKLASLLKYKEFWNDSFTKYRNTVGLTTEGKYLNYNSDVVLDFPFKDCVLEGGMTKENKGQDEIYYNEIIARDEIDYLLSPKVLTNIKRYSENKIEESVTDFNDSDNLIIKGNNLIALYSLKKRYANKIKLIYIDPPYNTGSDSFKYNDRFNRSTWLTFMKNRLEIARELLSDDGMIFVHCDDSEQAYLKILMDNIFDEANFKNMISIKSKVAGVSGSHQGKSLQNNVEYILFYSKNSLAFELTSIPQKEEELMNYIDRLQNEGISWKYVQVLQELSEPIKINEIKDGSGDIIKIYEHPNCKTKNINQVAKQEFNGNLKKAYYANIDKIFDTTNAQSSIRERVMEAVNTSCDIISIQYIPKSGKNKGKETTLYYKGPKQRLFTWLKDVTYLDKNGNIIRTENAGNLWDDISFNNINKEGDISFENGKKPEMILARLIEMCTEKKDIVLDFHLGSGTTCAVAHKMDRRYIGIEQMDYINEITVPRLQKVINGEQGGISKDVEWKGGGSFVYVEMMELNYQFIHKIENAVDYDALTIIFEEMKGNAHLNYQADLNKVLKASYEMDGMPRLVSFDELELHEQKTLLIELLDKNQLYVSLSEINDKTLNVSEADKAFNHSFYEKD